MSEFGFVYMFFRHKSDDKPVYVGFTTNPVQRLSGHFKDNSKGNGKLDRKAYEQITHIKVAYVGTERDAINMETQLIRAYAPEFNTEDVPPQGPSRNARVPNWREWPSLSKAEIIEDKTVAFRCFGANSLSESNNKDPSSDKKPVNDSQVRLMQIRIDSLQKSVEFWEHMYDEKSKEATHWYSELCKEMESNKSTRDCYYKLQKRVYGITG